MKKVLLMGLTNIENIGDHFVPKCVQYLVQNGNNSEWESRLISLVPSEKGFRYLLYVGLKIFARLIPRKTFSHKIVYLANRIREWQYYKKNINMVDAIIFSLGSYKYTTQDLWAYYALVIQIAEKKQIPVMFNAMNIQDYNEMDWRCRILKKYTNYSCVKMFTTRDGILGIDELKRYYVTNRNIRISAVGDSAYWIPACYCVSRKPGEVVGVNLIRGNIFIDYGKSMTKEELLDFYAAMLSELDAHNIKWELFTNGSHKDLQFGHALLKKTGRKGTIIRVPKSDAELPQIISAYKGIVGARLHACICAYALDVPMVGFVWDKKMLRFSQVAKLEDHFLREEELEASKMIQCLMKALQSDYDVQLRETQKQATMQKISEFLRSVGGK